MALTIGIVLFEDSEELDWAGPWEVFTMARTDGDRVVTIAETLDPVRCRKGLRVLPDHILIQRVLAFRKFGAIAQAKAMCAGFPCKKHPPECNDA